MKNNLLHIEYTHKYVSYHHKKIYNPVPTFIRIANTVKKSSNGKDDVEKCTMLFFVAFGIRQG